ncbi:ATP-binding protein [Chrysiogenes arsenatis]|uniref:ATP-binding protein n=1 Tax=Chrysiogenes arsenatis TaxID=309797 RepID=UPI00040D22D4|nr:ATP-binding protein [Chrysiogenes arsenatis]
MKSFGKVFLTIYLPIACVMLVVFSFSSTLLQDAARQELVREMQNKWNILATIDRFPTEFNAEMHQRHQQVTRDTSLRITLIAPDGTVISESHHDASTIATIDNHIARPEVIEAMARKTGYSLRHSDTTGMAMIYYAAKLPQSEMILRLAYPSTYLDQLRAEANRQHIAIFILCFFVVALIALYLARKITLPIQKLDFIAENVEAGNVDIEFPRFQDKTMTNVVELIYRIYRAMQQQKEALESEQAKLNHIFAILEEGIVLLDERNTILHANQKAEDYLGVSLPAGANILGDVNHFKIITFFKQILDSNSKKDWEKFLFEEHIFEVSYRRLTKEKLIVFFDVTEEARYEEYKAELVGNISHELRTPLAMIMGYAETILNDPDMPPATARRFLEIVFKSSRRLSDTIDDILKLSKLESKGNQFEITAPTMMSELRDELQERFGRLDNGRSLCFNIALESARVQYDHLLSILSNLIDNALKYSRGTHIHIALFRRDGQVWLEVEDEGPVIPREERERIFERFYTVSKSRNQSISGTGIGLSIVKHIVQLYRGSAIVVEGSRNGNLFRIRLREK